MMAYGLSALMQSSACHALPWKPYTTAYGFHIWSDNAMLCVKDQVPFTPDWIDITDKCKYKIFLYVVIWA